MDNHQRIVQRSIIVGEAVPEGMRLDTYAAEMLDELPSRKASHKAIRRGQIHLDGAISEPHIRVRPGQCVTLFLDDRAPPPVYDISLDVIWEDDHMAVINKPPGIPVSGNYVRTIERALGANLKPSAADNSLNWARPAHRLDAPTGGLLLVAKTASAMTALGRQFENREVSKEYTALVTGRLLSSGIVETPIDGREALTHYEPLAQTRSVTTDWLTTVRLKPVTGRTHQLRRHMSEIGHPIVGDRQYTTGKVLKSKGLFLWATRLSCSHPTTGGPLIFEIPPPPKFASFIKREERRWKRLNA